MWSPVDRSASQFGAGSLPPGCGGHCARSRVEGGGGVCRLIPTVPGGGTGPGASAFAVPRRLSVGGKWVAGLAGSCYEPLAADSVALFCHLLPEVRGVACACLTYAPDTALALLISPGCRRSVVLC